MQIHNKCSAGPETSQQEVEKLKAWVSFPPSDNCVAEASATQSDQGMKTFSQGKETRAKRFPPMGDLFSALQIHFL